MPYAERNILGEITSLLQFPKNEDNEYLEPSHPEIVAFTHKSCGKAESKDKVFALIQNLTQSRGEKTQIIEDLVALLIEKRAIIFNELPETLQSQLLKRKQLKHLVAFGADGYTQKDYPLSP